jgi:hypothetical protein
MTRTRVQMQIDVKTGELRLFQIDQETVEEGPAHERAHDRAAVAIGGVIGRRPSISQVRPAETAVQVEQHPAEEDAAEVGTRREQDRS